MEAAVAPRIRGPVSTTEVAVVTPAMGGAVAVRCRSTEATTAKRVSEAQAVEATSAAQAEGTEAAVGTAAPRREAAVAPARVGASFTRRSRPAGAVATTSWLRVR
ncbi:hypothetical protein PR202_ga13017 [Eleusine coracana subsp. coracana]|uniref:Uncharacterized protein n=1 Tax=Eleusine coracana subsp. coracana TaxID=191504 RepID=A0AAV5CDT5_ELECO|nr:hypothetical protein PR202_ga13017 [Eleusine coracana subsp. coracana]